jgi:hypothetical protein
VHASAWPSQDSTGTSIGDAVIAADATFEPSGVVWHSDREQLIAVGDEGQIAIISLDGMLIELYDLGNSYDLEDITIIPGESTYAYLLDENSSSVYQFDLDAGALTGGVWSLASAGDVTLSEVDGTSGLEGLAWVPDDYHPYGDTPSGGLLYAGWQTDGDIYIFEPNLSESGSVTFVEEIHMTTGYTDLSGLYFSGDTQLLYALYDGLDILEERSADGVLQASYSDIPGSTLEGITIIPTSDTAATVVMAEDSGRIMSYSGYSITEITPTVEEEVPVVEEETPAVEEPPAGEESPATEEVTTEETIEDEEPTTEIEEPVEEVEEEVPATETTTESVTVVRVRGRRHGKIRVQYSDDSVSVYRVLSKRLHRKTRVRMIDNSTVLARGTRKVAVVNALTGEVIVRHKRFFNRTRLNRWLQSKIGVTLE